MPVPKANSVPCNGCTVCCQRDMVFLHPEMGDDPSQYAVVAQADGRYTLQHKPNGDCIYLDRQTGCTIWPNHPAVCRELDCIVYLQIPRKLRKQLIKAGALTQKAIDAARARAKRR